MKVLAVGGGSGGHVTPAIAVLRELRKQKPEADIRFWVDRGFYMQATKSLSSFDKNMRVDSIVAGKFRRFAHVPMWRQMFWPSLMVPNIIDAFKVFFGFIQSFLKLVFWRPDVIFAKGGFVCLPVGWAARVLRIPLVLHDSDVVPGLTNRILAKHAKYIGTGAAIENYNYDSNKTVHVGVPTSVSGKSKSREVLKSELGYDPSKPLILVTGGGLGARRINEAVIKQKDKLSQLGKIILVAGEANYQECKMQLGEGSEIELLGFTNEFIKLAAAADVVVSRAGATTLAELSLLGAPSIIIPNPQLVGGHQVKNIQVYGEKGALIVVDEDKLQENSEILVRKIRELLNDKDKTKAMANMFYEFAKPNAARDMAQLIIKTSSK